MFSIFFLAEETKKKKYWVHFVGQIWPCVQFLLVKKRHILSL